MINDLELIVVFTSGDGAKIISTVYDIFNYKSRGKKIDSSGPIFKRCVKSMFLIFDPFESQLRWVKMDNCKVLFINKTPDERRIKDESGRHAGT